MFVFSPYPPGFVPYAQITRVSNIISQIPWVTSLMNLVPSWSNNAMALRNLGYNKARERLNRGAAKKDLYYHLESVRHPSRRSLRFSHSKPAQVDDTPSERQRAPVEDMLSDGTLAIVAGTDTIKTTLTAIFYHLLLNPACYQHLQDEVDQAFPDPDDPMDFRKLDEMEYLDACVYVTYPHRGQSGS